MTIKDIVNHSLVDLATCAEEPIHIPGSIQPHGFLLALKMPGLLIDFCSDNCIAYTGMSHQQLLGKGIEIIFGVAQTARIRACINALPASAIGPLEVKIVARVFNASVNTSEDRYLLELENRSAENISLSTIYQQTKQFTAYMEKAGTLQQLCQAVADETRAITRYDRVMIYRFDEDYNGEVFAESKTAEVEPFIGLHYPHTDIPVQARELYIRNLVRLIADVNYTPIPIYTIDDAPAKNLDLSLSTLRSVSPIHIQYLQNMGVAATLTISLMQNKRLWGLIACHHYAAKFVPADIRIAAQLQAHFLTSQINVRLLGEEYEVAKKVNKALDDLLVRGFSADAAGINDLVCNTNTLLLANASNVLIIIDSKIYSHGAVPPANEVLQLTSWLHTFNYPNGFNTSNLSLVYPDAKKFQAIMSGIVFHSLGKGLTDCIIWYRPEVLQEVKWAGNPLNTILKGEKGLSPRKSFELWQEVKKGASTKWQGPELVAAASFANALQKQVYMSFLTTEELKHRTLSEKLKEANAELENLNWIGSHDLKEPLRKIQLFASVILDKKGEGASEAIINAVSKMNDSAKRMQVLLADILSYSRLNHIENGFAKVSLNLLLTGTITELDDEIAEKNATITCGVLPEINGITFLLEQLFINLLRNALKFSQPGIAPMITITMAGPAHFPGKLMLSGQHYYGILVQDNGIGFDNHFSESIFNVFTRLHKNDSIYGGSGVGLAMCKKIMQNHKGFIVADSKKGQGAGFMLYFPKQPFD